MNNDYQDYQLEDMENQAVNNSNKYKKAAVIGAAALGVGGTAAYAATKIGDNTPADELTADDILDAAEAGAVDGEVINETQTTAAQTAAQPTEEVHVHNHYYTTPEEQTPEVTVEETGIVVDDEGNIVNTFDRGTIDGKEFIAMDTNGNGAADVLAYDENGNGVFEDREIVAMDDQSYMIGNGNELHAYHQDVNGNLTNIDDIAFADLHQPDGYNDDDVSRIHNDFSDEKDGVYHDDLAHNNPDYRNDEGNDYNAGIEESGLSNDMAYEKYDATDDTMAESFDDSYVSEDFTADASDFGADNGLDAGFDDGTFEA